MACRGPTVGPCVCQRSRPAGSAAEGAREQATERTSRCVSERRARQRTDAPPHAGRLRRLLDLDLAALLLEGGLDLLRLVLGDAFLDGLGRGVDEVLGLLEAEAGQLADDLDDRDLVRARSRSGSR